MLNSIGIERNGRAREIRDIIGLQVEIVIGRIGLGEHKGLVCLATSINVGQVNTPILPVATLGGKSKPTAIR